MKRELIKDIVIFENADYLAINKPHGISTLDDRSGTIHILSIVKSRYPEIQVCHRIDKDTSGVLVFAKNNESYRHLSLQFQERKVNKVYHAVVLGSSNYKNYVIDFPLTIKAQGIVRWDSKKGKESKTFISTLANYKAFSLLECKPITGRRHQIRVHLKSVNHPIIADKKYSGKDLYLSQIKKTYRSGGKEEKPIINRMALHARSICFHSKENKGILIEAPYPKDYKILIKQLNKYCSVKDLHY